MIEVLVGLGASLFGVALFISGFLFGVKMAKPQKVEPTPLSNEELETLKQEQNAFQSLLSYNADNAYGTKPFEI